MDKDCALLRYHIRDKRKNVGRVENLFYYISLECGDAKPGMKDQPWFMLFIMETRIILFFRHYKDYVLACILCMWSRTLEIGVTVDPLRFAICEAFLYGSKKNKLHIVEDSTVIDYEDVTFFDYENLRINHVL
jgi:hypothetical protein